MSPSSDVEQRIPIRNIWLLMAYAADVNTLLSQKNVKVEEIPEHLPDLLAKLLSSEIRRRFRGKLSVNFETVEREESRVKGNIRHLKTDRSGSMLRGRVVCSYNVLSHDTEVNRLVFFAIRTLSKFLSRDLSLECRQVENILRMSGVTQMPRSKLNIQIQASDRRDNRMVALSKLALALDIPSQIEGGVRLFDPELGQKWLPQLYEKAIFGFYKYHLDSNHWLVNKSILKWPILDTSKNFERYMPVMRTDIEITNLDSGQRTIIDTKFTSLVVANRGKDIFKSGHLYQIYAYLRTQEEKIVLGTKAAPETSGMLLYPEIGQSIHEHASIQDHELHLVTVNLGAESDEITRFLLSLFEKDTSLLSE